MTGLSELGHFDGHVVVICGCGHADLPLASAFADRGAQLVHTSYALHRPYITPLPDAGLSRYTLHNSPPPTSPVRWRAGDSVVSLVWLFVQQLANMLGVIGALLMMLHRRASIIIWRVGLLGLVAVGMLAMIKLSGMLANFYNWDRAFLQASVVLAVTLCWPLRRLASRPRLGRVSTLAVAASLTVILICTSGLANVALGGGTPLTLATSGEGFDRFYLTGPELASASWLGQAVRPGQPVYAPRYAQPRLFAMTGNTLSTIGDVTPLTPDQHAWVYADRTNVLDRSAETLFNNSTVTYMFPAGFLDRNYDLVYTNGSSEVYHR